MTQLIGIICFMAGLLPKNHPSFSKTNKAHYTLVSILADAARGIEFKWKHIDKIIVYAMIVCGTVMMWLYVVGAIVFLLVSPSIAGTFAAMVQTGAPANDIAFMMLDKIFGVPGLYNSSVSFAAPFPSPFQTALQQLFRFYSLAIFVIALVIFLYHMVHWILDITQTGKVAEHMSDDIGDGGKGFSWLPIRFVFCFGLLLPFGMGFNSGQWITLYTAKYGSGLATNAWIQYNLGTGNNPTGDLNAQLVARPVGRDNSAIIKSLMMMRSCMQIYAWGTVIAQEKDKLAYLVKGSQNHLIYDHTPTSRTGFIEAWDKYNASPSTIASADPNDDFIQMLTFAGNSDLRVVIGEFDPAEPDKYKQYPGKVLPVCGSFTVPLTGRTGEAIFAAEGYLFAALNLLFDTNRPSVGRSDQERELSAALSREYMRTSSANKNWLRQQYGATVPPVILDTYVCGKVSMLGPCDQPILAAYWKEMMVDYYYWVFGAPPFSAYDFLADTDTALQFDVDETYIFAAPTSFSTIGAQNPLLMTVGILQYGWGGAGLWYNKIGERNGSLYAAVSGVPMIDRFPLVMENIKEARAKTDTKVAGGFCEKFNPRKSGGSSSYLPTENSQFEAEQATALYGLCSQLFENGLLNMDGVTRSTRPTNEIESAIQKFFSEFMLFNGIDNKDVAPMAQLTSMGRILIDKAIVSVSVSALSYAAGGLAHEAAGDDRRAHEGAKSFASVGSATMAIAMLGLSSGFVLYYMLPVLPFIYFFFAVGRWVKVIFEAMVGVPLWALAHMRVGGPGLPGSAAIGGYFLILEIFIRPILTVFSLIAAYAIFSALVVGLNSVFSLISANLFGGQAPAGAGLTAMTIAMARGMIDQFFLSIFYVFFVYTIGTGCFKLIDILPDNIMRWSGAGVQSFGASDESDDMVTQWQWELPHRFDGGVSALGQGIKSALYTPQAQAAEKLVAAGEEKREKAKAEAKAKAKAAAARENQSGGDAQG